MDTIFALASAPGKAGISVVRLSGPKARAAARLLCAGADLPRRGMSLKTLQDTSGELLDKAVVLTFLAPSSFTGEDVVEFHVHGSVAVVSSLIDVLSGVEGLRMAEPGEFTRRALENDRLDLTQVEGLADLIDAETDAQRRQAQRTLAGELGAMVDQWRSSLIRAAALIEATIDFADEEVPTDVTPEVLSILTFVQEDLRRQTEGVLIAERIRSGFEVAIVGPPNVGKSTLLNTLAGRQAAITSEIAGTTRDVIEVRMDLGGLPVTLLDTAGLRDTQDHVEGLGVELAKARATAADLRVFLVEDLIDIGVEDRPGDILVRPKADLRTNQAEAVSGLTGAGIDELVARIADEIKGRAQAAGIATRARHKQAMERAAKCLAIASEVMTQGPDQYDIAAAELRFAIRALESLVGRIDVENLLDEIFASFCVGK